jgi:hypothetical protein
MEYQLSFSQLINYDAGLPGISLDLTLSLVDASVTLTAKLDTGATNCIFERRFGERLDSILKAASGYALALRLAASSLIVIGSR